MMSLDLEVRRSYGRINKFGGIRDFLDIEQSSSGDKTLGKFLKYFRRKNKRNNLVSKSLSKALSALPRSGNNKWIDSLVEKHSEVDNLLSTEDVTQTEIALSIYDFLKERNNEKDISLGAKAWGYVSKREKGIPKKLKSLVDRIKLVEEQKDREHDLKKKQKRIVFVAILSMFSVMILVPDKHTEKLKDSMHQKYDEIEHDVLMKTLDWLITDPNAKSTINLIETSVLKGVSSGITVSEFLNLLSSSKAVYDSFSDAGYDVDVLSDFAQSLGSSMEEETHEKMLLAIENYPEEYQQDLRDLLDKENPYQKGIAEILSNSQSRYSELAEEYGQTEYDVFWDRSDNYQDYQDLLKHSFFADDGNQLADEVVKDMEPADSLNDANQVIHERSTKGIDSSEDIKDLYDVFAPDQFVSIEAMNIYFSDYYDFIFSSYSQDELPLEVSDVLAFALMKNKGDMRMAFWDTTVVLKVLTRNTVSDNSFIGSFKNTRSGELSINMILDPFSFGYTAKDLMEVLPDSQYWDILGDGEGGLSKDFDPANLAGLPYHMMNLMAFSSELPTSSSIAGLIADYFGYGGGSRSYGNIKLIYQLEYLLQNQYDLKTFLDNISRNREENELTRSSIYYFDITLGMNSYFSISQEKKDILDSLDKGLVGVNNNGQFFRVKKTMDRRYLIIASNIEDLSIIDSKSTVLPYGGNGGGIFVSDVLDGVMIDEKYSYENDGYEYNSVENIFIVFNTYFETGENLPIKMLHTFLDENMLADLVSKYDGKELELYLYMRNKSEVFGSPIDTEGFVDSILEFLTLDEINNLIIDDLDVVVMMRTFYLFNNNEDFRKKILENEGFYLKIYDDLFLNSDQEESSYIHDKLFKFIIDNNLITRENRSIVDINRFTLTNFTQTRYFFESYSDEDSNLKNIWSEEEVLSSLIENDVFWGSLISGQPNLFADIISSEVLEEMLSTGGMDGLVRNYDSWSYLWEKKDILNATMSLNDNYVNRELFFHDDFFYDLFDKDFIVYLINPDNNFSPYFLFESDFVREDYLMDKESLLDLIKKSYPNRWPDIITEFKYGEIPSLLVDDLGVFLDSPERLENLLSNCKSYTSWNDVWDISTLYNLIKQKEAINTGKYFYLVIENYFVFHDFDIDLKDFISPREIEFFSQNYHRTWSNKWSLEEVLIAIETQDIMVEEYSDLFIEK